MLVNNVFNAEDGSLGNQVGKFAKDFSYLCGDGTTHRLSEFREQKVVLIKLWSISCSYCIQSFPAFEALHNEYSEDGLLVLGMNLNDSIGNILRIVGDYNFINAYKSSNYMLTGYNLIPLYILIDKSGKIQFIGTNQLPTDQKIKNLLGI